MKQWTTLMDGINSLKLDTVPQPVELEDGEVLVKIDRVALNHRDAKSMHSKSNQQE
jgi:NADPH:quinone reductase-like Zn-dependent oxidoreductase